MKLRKEVLNRLLLAKSILPRTTGSMIGQTNEHRVAREVLNAHDAADLVFAAIADQKKKLPARAKAPAMIECLELIGSSGKKDAAYFRQLNDARNGLKHVGNLPNVQQWSAVIEDVFVKLSDLCRATLRVSLDQVSELDLLENSDVKAHLTSAKQCGASGNHKAGLEEVGKALCVALVDHPDLWDIKVGTVKAEDALKLTAFGIPANEFLRLQQFLPSVPMFFPNPMEASWAQADFGHPGNWRQDSLEFCIEACLAVAVGIQSVSAAPVALEFESLYDYRVTATAEKVEVWEDLVKGHLAEIHSETRPFRSHNRYLTKGECVEVSGHAEPFVSDDLSTAGKWIKRVQISRDLNLFGIGDARGEFVDLAEVKITCVPKGFLGPRFDYLKEIPWEPDSETQSFLGAEDSIEH